MAILIDFSDEAQRAVPAASTMKLPQMLRRSSTTDGAEKLKERDNRRSTIAEPERKTSLSNIPLRLRRKKTQPIYEQSEEDVQSASKLGDHFFSLPYEILTEILTELSLHDILALRLTSHPFHQLLDSNAPLLTRHLLQATLPPQTQHHIQTHLYAAPTQCTTLTHLLATLKRQTTIHTQIYNLLSFVQMKIYMTRTSTRVLSVSDNRSRLITAFQRPAWFVSHFLESYRHIITHDHPIHLSTSDSPIPNCSSCNHCRAAARAVIATYPPDDIMPAWHFYQLCIEHLQIATRAPSSAGALERRLRGWGKKLATEESLAVFVVLGGIPEIRKVAMMQGSYNSRLAFVLEFCEKVREAVTVNEIVGEGGSSKSREEGQRFGSKDVRRTLDPEFQLLTQEHISSLPDIGRFFFDIWRDRIHELADDRADVMEPYSWLGKVMSGSGLEFGNLRVPEPSLVLGASPV